MSLPCAFLKPGALSPDGKGFLPRQRLLLKPDQTRGEVSYSWEWLFIAAVSRHPCRVEDEMSRVVQRKCLEDFRWSVILKEGLIKGGARHCCPDSVWHGARRKWMNILDQRATKPRRMGCGRQPAELFFEPRAQRCSPAIRFYSKWRVEQLIIDIDHRDTPVLFSERHQPSRKV